MTGADPRRVFVGLLAAWGTAVAVGAVAACIFVAWLVKMGAQDSGAFLGAAASGPKDALTILLLAAITGAADAAPIAFVGIFGLAWPLYLRLRKFPGARLRHYLAAGLAVAAVIDAALIGLHDWSKIDLKYYAEILAIPVAGPMAMLTFWLVVRPDRTG